MSSFHFQFFCNTYLVFLQFFLLSCWFHIDFFFDFHHLISRTIDHLYFLRFWVSIITNRQSNLLIMVFALNDDQSEKKNFSHEKKRDGNKLFDLFRGPKISLTESVVFIFCVTRHFNIQTQFAYFRSAITNKINQSIDAREDEMSGNKSQNENKFFSWLSTPRSMHHFWTMTKIDESHSHFFQLEFTYQNQEVNQTHQTLDEEYTPDICEEKPTNRIECSIKFRAFRIETIQQYS